MITKNFKNILALVLESFNTPNGQIEAVNTSNMTVYMGPSMTQFPYAANGSIITGSSASLAGIHIGTGNTPATENDYKLESRISSGITAQSPTKTFSLDANGNPQLEHVFMLTNTTAADIVVSEIGYIQSFYASTTKGGSTTSNAFLLDRTVLASPVTVPANGNAVIKYTLKTVVAS